MAKTPPFVYKEISAQLMVGVRMLDHVNNYAKKKILRKLFTKHFVGARHTSFENIRKSFDKNEYPVAEEAIKELVREGFLNWHPTSYGKQYSLNSRMLTIVKDLLED